MTLKMPLRRLGRYHHGGLRGLEFGSVRALQDVDMSNVCGDVAKAVSMAEGFAEVGEVCNLPQNAI